MGSKAKTVGMFSPKRTRTMNLNQYDINQMNLDKWFQVIKRGYRSFQQDLGISCIQ